MGSILKYLAYALVIAFAASWVMVVFKSCSGAKEPIILSSVESGKAALSDAATTAKGKVIGDLMEDEEADSDYGDGEDDLEELDEDEILAEVWDEEDEDDDETDEALADESEEESAEENETTSYEKVVTTSSNGKFLVIGGSFSTKGNANTFVNQLAKLGYEDAEVVVFDKAKKYHTVSVARFDSKNDASKLVGALKRKGIPDAYVHKKRG